MHSWRIFTGRRQANVMKCKNISYFTFPTLLIIWQKPLRTCRKALNLIGAIYVQFVTRQKKQSRRTMQICCSNATFHFYVIVNQLVLTSTYHKITVQFFLMQQHAEIKGNRQFLWPQKRSYDGRFTIWQLFTSLSRKWR